MLDENSRSKLPQPESRQRISSVREKKNVDAVIVIRRPQMFIEEIHHVLLDLARVWTI